MRRESVARSGTSLTLGDPASGWTACGVALLTGPLQRWRGVKGGTDRILLRTRHVHGRGLATPLLAIGLDAEGRVVDTAVVQPGRFLRLPGATWVLELRDGNPPPVPGACLDLYARRGERQTDPLCNTYRQSG